MQVDHPRVGKIQKKRCRDGKRTETRIGMEGICITHSCIPLIVTWYLLFSCVSSEDSAMEQIIIIRQEGSPKSHCVYNVITLCLQCETLPLHCVLRQVKLCCPELSSLDQAATASMHEKKCPYYTYTQCFIMVTEYVAIAVCREHAKHCRRSRSWRQS